jgi:2-amino-4-hydroxy-6-hydroxymethyldihydropteridine diphosphokinase
MLYLGLGSNLGDKRDNLLQAVALISERVGRVVCLSRFYETEPWGYDTSNTYLNAALGVETSLSPLEVLSITQAIERELGRQKKSMNREYSDRPIDIDLLLMDDLVVQTDVLTLPHSLMHERLFVLEPLVEIAPTVIHPVLQQSVCAIYNALVKSQSTSPNH